MKCQDEVKIAFIPLRTAKKRFRSEINAVFFGVSEYPPTVSIKVHFPNLEEIPWHSCQLLDNMTVSP